MSFIVATAIADDPVAAAATHPELWRQARRFNLPVKLALTSAHDVAAQAHAPAEAWLVSLSPCRAGSPELWRATHAFETDLARTGKAARVRVNPTYTLHAIDNLALSALAIDLANHAPCLGLGGAAGQAWCALEWILEQTSHEARGELLLFAGDQTATGETALGVAVLFRASSSAGEGIRLVSVERAPLPRAAPAVEPRADAAAGLRRWLDALAAFSARARGPFAYEVQAVDGDGRDRITIVTEVT